MLEGFKDFCGRKKNQLKNGAYFLAGAALGVGGAIVYDKYGRKVETQATMPEPEPEQEEYAE